MKVSINKHCISCGKDSKLVLCNKCNKEYEKNACEKWIKFCKWIKYECTGSGGVRPRNMGEYNEGLVYMYDKINNKVDNLNLKD